MEAIRVQVVGKTYGNGLEKESILRDVSFALEEGSFTALTGISGSSFIYLRVCRIRRQGKYSCWAEICGK